MIKVKFSDFWDSFVPSQNYFYDLLISMYDIELSGTPDILFYSVFGEEHLKYSCKKIFFSGEKISPDFSLCDYSFSYDFIEDSRHYRLPLYALYVTPEQLLKESEIVKIKDKFCCFVVTNSEGEKRNNFFHKLSKYKRVDSGGMYLNNIGNFIANKWDFIKNYKFTISYENAEYPGYTSEKIAEAMVNNTIPLYWGNPLVYRDFNTKSFFNYYDYSSEEEMIERIIEVDQNDDLYVKMMQQSWYNNNQINEYIKKENIMRHFRTIIEGSTT